MPTTIESAPPPALFLTEDEVAQLLGIHRTTLWRSVMYGELRDRLHPIPVTAHTRRYRRDEVEALAGDSAKPTTRK